MNFNKDQVIKWLLIAVGAYIVYEWLFAAPSTAATGTSTSEEPRRTTFAFS